MYLFWSLIAACPFVFYCFIFRQFHFLKFLFISIATTGSSGASLPRAEGRGGLCFAQTQTHTLAG
jgi:hypothetical protein